MARKEPFTLIYDIRVIIHLRSIERKYHLLIRQTIEEQLGYEPETQTRNRKPLERPISLGAKWELRFGPNNRFRVFYRVNYETHEVYVLAIGFKQGNKLIIGGEEFE